MVKLEVGYSQVVISTCRYTIPLQTQLDGVLGGRSYGSILREIPMRHLDVGIAKCK